LGVRRLAMRTHARKVDPVYRHNITTELSKLSLAAKLVRTVADSGNMRPHVRTLQQTADEISMSVKRLETLYAEMEGTPQ